MLILVNSSYCQWFHICQDANFLLMHSPSILGNGQSVPLFKKLCEIIKYSVPTFWWSRKLPLISGNVLSTYALVSSSANKPLSRIWDVFQIWVLQASRACPAPTYWDWGSREFGQSPSFGLNSPQRSLNVFTLLTISDIFSYPEG